MMKKSEFDHLLKANLIARLGYNPFGYTPTGSDRTYDLYFHNQAFSSFITDMKAFYPDAYCQYGSGKGSELEEHGIHPPKMASIASSSRFCYLALRNGASALGGGRQVKFEHGCRITGVPGIPPQLDAYIPQGTIYVEAKCHEIFDSHKTDMKIKYWPCLYGSENSFGLPTAEQPDAEQFHIPPADFGIETDRHMFDVKQFLCHLLGIASQKHESATLVYLFFKPQADSVEAQRKIDAIFDALSNEIKSIFQSSPIQQFCQAHSISLRAVAECAPIMEPLTFSNLITLG